MFRLLIIVILLVSSSSSSFTGVYSSLDDYLTKFSYNDSYDIDKIIQGICPLLQASNQYSQLSNKIIQFSNRNKDSSICVDNISKLRKINQIIKDIKKFLSPDQHLFYNCILHDFLEIIKISNNCKASENEQKILIEDFLNFFNDFINF